MTGVLRSRRRRLPSIVAAAGVLSIIPLLGEPVDEPRIQVEEAWVGRNVLVREAGEWERYTLGRSEGGVFLRLQHSADRGISWSEPEPLARFFDETGGAVATLEDRDGSVHVFLQRRRPGWGPGGPMVDRFIDLWHARSEPGRTDWTEPQLVFEGYVGHLSKAVQMESGRIVLPFGYWGEDRTYGPPYGPHTLITKYSDDGGTTWKRSASELTSPVYEGYNGLNYGACEPTIAELGDGRLWMLFRTQTGYLYESFSRDGSQWTPARPSRFHASTGPPELTRLPDGRLMLFWNNAAMPPRVEGAGVYGGRDALHAAISEDDGETWIGFREIYLDPARNETPPRRGDRGTAYPEGIVDGEDYVYVVSGQARRVLLAIDPDWLYETGRRSDFAKGLEDWSVFKAFGPAEGWWRDRVRGAVVAEDPDEPALHVRRPDDWDPDGAVWNFPTGHAGSVSFRLKLNEGFDGVAVALADRFFDPSDDSGEAHAVFGLRIDGDGRLPGGHAFSKGEWQTVSLEWDLSLARCEVVIDGETAVGLSPRNLTRNGINYLRFRSTAGRRDPEGVLIRDVRAAVSERKPVTWQGREGE